MVDFKGHVERTVELMVSGGLRALVVMGGSNIHYLVGSDAPSAVVVRDDGSLKTISTRLEYTRTLDEARLGEHYALSRGEEVADFERVVEGDLHEALARLLADVGGGKVGCVSLPAELREKLSSAVGLELADVTRGFLALRRRKDRSELEALRSAARIAEQALLKAVGALERGVTEAEVAAVIVSAMLRAGSRPAFPPIVAFGEHAAHPHAQPTLRPLRRGDVVKVDLGARVEGYCSDITRTFVYGSTDGGLREALSAVLKAQEESIARIGPGVPAREVHQYASRVLREHGLLRYFNHGLGHGVGLDVHEEPYLNSRSDTVLQQGDVITVEPGVYVWGKFGVRVEDMVLITPGGPDVITTFPRLYELG